MNREGKTYRCHRIEFESGVGHRNGSVALVTRSTSWNPFLGDMANYTHDVLVLECPLDPSMVGATGSVDERIYVPCGGKDPVSTFEIDDAWTEI